MVGLVGKLIWIVVLFGVWMPIWFVEGNDIMMPLTNQRHVLRALIL
jgi:hypothetical protein